MKLLITARNKFQDNTDYTKLDNHGLKATVELADGIGSPIDPTKAIIQIHNESNTNWMGVVHIELPFTKLEPRFFLPAFMYGRNRGEAPQNVSNEFPRLRDGSPARPSSPWWMVRGDRLSHPAALVYDNGKVYGICASPYLIWNNGNKEQWNPDKEGEFYQYSGYSCSLSKGSVGYTLGYENAPWLFIKSKLVKDRSPLVDNCIEIESGETLTLSIDIYEYEAESELGINLALKEIYYRYHQHPRTASNVQTALTDLSKAVYEYAWLEEEKNYSTFVFEDKKSNTYEYRKLNSISWTNGLSVAVPILMSAIRLNDEAMREQALACITNIVENSLNPSSGLPYDAFQDGKWSINGWWFDGMRTPGHSSYLAGQTIYYILKAYDYEKTHKSYNHPDWLIFANKVLTKLETTKNTDHEYPFILSERTGSGIEYDAFAGSWCMAALAFFCYLTKDRTHIDSLLRSEKHYYETYVKKMECYGAPLDADKAVDSEGILAYIKATKYIHLITGDDKYLEHMKDAINYEFTFKFCYNSPIKIPPLSNIGWSSCGGSVTSVANPHIHPMSSNLIDELLYYVTQTNDCYVRDRMIDTIQWGCQTYNRFDNEFDYGKKGWMSERFCHSEGLVTQKYSDDSLASTWFCLMPWASGSILEGLSGDYWELINAKDI